MLKMRFGALPLIDVKIPPPTPSVRRSSQCARIAMLKAAVGRHALVKALLLLTNWMLPFELTLAEVKVVP
jgi:hypothetical protein